MDPRYQHSKVKVITLTQKFLLTLNHALPLNFEEEPASEIMRDKETIAANIELPDHDYCTSWTCNFPHRAQRQHCEGCHEKLDTLGDLVKERKTKKLCEKADTMLPHNIN